MPQVAEHENKSSRILAVEAKMCEQVGCLLFLVPVFHIRPSRHVPLPAHKRLLSKFKD